MHCGWIHLGSTINNELVTTTSGINNASMVLVAAFLEYIITLHSRSPFVFIHTKEATRYF